MSRITGRVEVLVNGNLMLNKEGATASGIGISGQPTFAREPVLGDTGLHGYKETAMIAQVDVTITDRDDQKLSELNAINGDGTIIFRSAVGGKTYIMNNATCHSNLTVTAGEGETPIVFSGPNWVETT